MHLWHEIALHTLIKAFRLPLPDSLPALSLSLALFLGGGGGGWVHAHHSRNALHLSPNTRTNTHAKTHFQPTDLHKLFHRKKQKQNQQQQKIMYKPSKWRQSLCKLWLLLTGCCCYCCSYGCCCCCLSMPKTEVFRLFEWVVCVHWHFWEPSLWIIDCEISAIYEFSLHRSFPSSHFPQSNVAKL